MRKDKSLPTLRDLMLLLATGQFRAATSKDRLDWDLHGDSFVHDGFGWSAIFDFGSRIADPASGKIGDPIGYEVSVQNSMGDGRAWSVDLASGKIEERNY